jgi:hypothetical protein
VGFAHVTQAWFEQDPAAFVRLESLLRARYPTLHAFIVDGECRIRGTFAAVEADRYALDIALPANYPHAIPSVWETGGRIPREIDRHVFDDGSLCLGAPLALWMQLGGDYSIERLIDGPLRSFLIGNSLVEEREPWPYGDRTHGAAGLLEHLGELIGTSDPQGVGRFLIDLLDKKVRGHWLCPCGSGLIIRKCHRDGVGMLQKAPARLLVHAVEAIAKHLEARQQSAAAGV